MRLSLTHTFPFVPLHLVPFWSVVHPHPKNGFILGTGAAGDRDHVVYLSLGEPRAISQSSSASGPDPLLSLQKKLSASFSPENAPRFVGFLGYEAGRMFESGVRRQKARPHPLRTPAYLIGEYDEVLKLDMRRREMTLFVFGPHGRRRGKVLIEKIQRAYSRQLQSSRIPQGKPRSRRLSFHGKKQHFRFMGYPAFASQVRRAKESIRSGDIYQANISIRFSGAFSGDALTLYTLLCRRNPSPYACLIKGAMGWVVSCSPELLLHVAGEKITTRPIAGTRPRGESRRRDQERKGQLLLSPKERAEHTMLVDLERNDLGRVSRPGTVHATDRFAVERYSHVMHIVSGVEGRLAEGKTAIDALRALFPGGTITGCPKIRSIEIIAELEKTARGPFYGSAGYFAWNGDAQWNILIRTALIQKRKITIQAGAGIVADSHPRREYREVFAKAQALLEASYDCVS